MPDDDPSRLTADLNSAKANYQKAMKEFNQIAQQAANPDSLEAIKLAHDRLNKATDEYGAALKAFAEHFRKKRSATQD